LPVPCATSRYARKHKPSSARLALAQATVDGCLEIVDELAERKLDRVQHGCFFRRPRVPRGFLIVFAEEGACRGWRDR
jgi:hypothetical protein